MKEEAHHKGRNNSTKLSKHAVTMFRSLETGRE
jgi:hypothetical protein